jgi:hypothetical protein
MMETRICPECEMEFDWPGVQVDGEVYCCEACSRGEPCECEQHQQQMLDTAEPMPTPAGRPGPI